MSDKTELSDNVLAMWNAFKTEVRLIDNPFIRELVIGVFDNVPSHFWTQPSSGSGRFHPKDEREQGGLVLHTKRVVRLVEHLCHSYGYYGIERDKLIAAALIHDVGKFGWGEEPAERQVHGHETLPREQLETIDEVRDNPFFNDVFAIAEGHSGRWGPSRPFSDTGLAALASILHIADYIASRSDVMVDLTSEDARDS